MKIKNRVMLKTLKNIIISILLSIFVIVLFVTSPIYMNAFFRWLDFANFVYILFVVLFLTIYIMKKENEWDSKNNIRE